MLPQLKLFLLLIPSILFFSPATAAQTMQGFIYGKVTLTDGSVYEGRLRWEDEEAFWDDIFDAYKYDHPSGDLLPTNWAAADKDGEAQFSYGFMALWDDQNRVNNFSFRCRFGDMVSLEMVDSKIAILRLKNGQSIPLNRKRPGDLDETIRVYRPGKGRLELPVQSIASIRFKAAPATAVDRQAAAVYGKVLTTQGTYEGYITWDAEERLAKDVITGRRNGTKVDLEFGAIAMLSAHEDGSLVRLKSGESFFLNGHDDVAPGNHGIAIRDLPYGKVEISWSNFISATFHEAPRPARGYQDFGPPRRLRGCVSLKDGAQYVGQLVYDLDERYDIELLNGKNNGLTYHIPFGAVARIVPQNDKYTSVLLKDGTELLLGGHSDVTADNHGLLIELEDGRNRYLPWDDIKSIDLG